MNETAKKSILVVDDENSNIMALSHILSPDYIIYAAKNGQSAIKAVEKHCPDIILLDIIMPEMDGYAVISALKASDKTRNIPVVFITGLTNADDEERGLTLGAADYITKPFSPAIVKLRVRNQIQILDQLHTIERLSMLDQLTELPNRRSFDNRLQAEWGRAARQSEPISILVIDVDKFKIYNDTYGHQQGDVALQAAAKIFEKELKRPGDFAARWGGEEFTVLLPNTSSSGALEVAEQIRARIENLEILCPDGTATGITVSIGVNTWSHERTGTTNNFISSADEALYKAKEAGRNRVCAV
ncbi:MAG: diguanylate cyclase [Oscillospiraceae bacterium]|nr:diguanylate cyclase [Oscillospiraceae bacterium]